jgi:hypothetical protein
MTGTPAVTTSAGHRGETLARHAARHRQLERCDRCALGGSKARDAVGSRLQRVLLRPGELAERARQLVAVEPQRFLGGTFAELRRIVPDRHFAALLHVVEDLLRGAQRGRVGAESGRRRHVVRRAARQGVGAGGHRPTSGFASPGRFVTWRARRSSSVPMAAKSSPARCSATAVK